MCAELVGLKRDGAKLVDVAALRKAKTAAGLDIVFAAIGQIVHFGHVECHFDRFPSCNLLECGLLSLGTHKDANTLKCNIAAYMYMALAIWIRCVGFWANL